MKNKLTQEFYDKMTLDNFNETQEHVKRDSINWATAVIDSVVTKRDVIEGMDVMKLKVHFTSNKKQFAVSATKVVKTVNGWKLSNGYHVNPKSRS